MDKLPLEKTRIKIDHEKLNDCIEGCRRIAAQHNLPPFAERSPVMSSHVDMVWALSHSPAGTEPVRSHVHAYKHRTNTSTFPSSFPGMEGYGKGFGSNVSPEWLRTHVPEYSRVTFRTYSRSGEPLWDSVVVHGALVPGTMLEHHSRRPDVCPRIGIVVGARPADDAVDVVWAPWAFRGVER